MDTSSALDLVRVIVVYVVLLRVPVICGLLLVLLPLIFLRGKPDLLANLFDVNAFGLGLATLTAVLCAWTVLITGWTILCYGPQRFPAAGDWSEWGFPAVWWFAGAMLAAAPVAWAALRYSRAQNAKLSTGQLGIGLAAGVLVAWVLQFGFTVLVAQLEPLRQWQGWPHLVPNIGVAGYLDEAGNLAKGHFAAALLFAVSFGVYLILGRFKRSHRGEPSGVPTIVYVLLLIMLACWGFAALTFALDRYHVPVLLTVLVWLVAFSGSPKTDHFYDTRVIPYVPPAQPNDPNRPPTPAEILQSAPDGKVILVAASGGGIQAAAWTTRVLTGLTALAAERFTRALRLISSVSGGSVGAMYFSSCYQGGTWQPDAEHGPVQCSEESSLEDVAWGLVYPDLWRVLFPWGGVWKKGGRGRALERAWMHTERLQNLLSVNLTSWVPEVRSGKRPANIFNATMAETGDRLLFATTTISDPVTTGAGVPPARWNFYDFYPTEDKKQTHDVAIVTAARLSATFPYVTPASRPDIDGPYAPQIHVVDGGYFDNYGMATLLEWLQNGLTELKRTNSPALEGLKVLIVEIHEAADPHRMAPPQLRNPKSWFFQLYAPLTTLFAVRTSSQRSRDRVELDGLRALWGAGKVEHALFEFGTPNPDTVVPREAVRVELAGRMAAPEHAPELSTGQTQAVDPPLSWHLTELQKQNIEEQWRLQQNNTEAQKVMQFLGVAPRP